VRWAGDPSKPTTVDRHGVRLTPRGSFAEWLEVTRRQAAPWSDVDIDLAEALRVVFLETVLRSVDMAQRERAFEETRIMAEELEKRVALRTEQLRALAADLEAVEERERRQIARDLHDDLGQTLAAAQIRISILRGDDRPEVRAAAVAVSELIDRANGAIRSLAAQLAPHVLHELGLCPALEWLGEEIERTFGLRVTIVDQGLCGSLAQEARSILYRAVRELLINVAKHAQTDAAVVEVEELNDQVIVTVSDRGIGYDQSLPLRDGRRALGLLSLRERLSYIGGTVTLRSSPGVGTVGILRAPLTAATRQAVMR
jgi:signal transduction histidine kinase